MMQAFVFGLKAVLPTNSLIKSALFVSEFFQIFNLLNFVFQLCH